MTPKILAPPLALLLLLLLPSAPAWSLGERPRQAPAPRVGDQAPGFTLPMQEGGEVSLAELRGQVVFLNFWASWCPPCREEMPSMDRLHEVLGGRGMKMLAVNVEEDDAAVERFLKMNPVGFPVLRDRQGDVQGLYGVYKFPETFLIDRQGRIVDHVLGGRDWSSVEWLQRISALLDGKRP